MPLAFSRAMASSGRMGTAMSMSTTGTPSSALRTAPPTKRASPSAAMTCTVSGAVIQPCCAGSSFTTPAWKAHLAAMPRQAGGTAREQDSRLGAQYDRQQHRRPDCASHGGTKRAVVIVMFRRFRRLLRQPDAQLVHCDNQGPHLAA